MSKSSRQKSCKIIYHTLDSASKYSRSSHLEIPLEPQIECGIVMRVHCFTISFKFVLPIHPLCLRVPELIWWIRAVRAYHVWTSLQLMALRLLGSAALRLGPHRIHNPGMQMFLRCLRLISVPSRPHDFALFYNHRIWLLEGRLIILHVHLPFTTFLSSITFKVLPFQDHFSTAIPTFSQSYIVDFLIVSDSHFSSPVAPSF